MNASRPLLRPRAFTLIELLTVIAIIGILAAILIPVVGSAKQRANSAHARGSLRQLGVGFSAFAAENKDRVPTSVIQPGRTNLYAWDYFILPYLGFARTPVSSRTGENRYNFFVGQVEGITYHRGDIWREAPSNNAARRSFTMPMGGVGTAYALGDWRNPGTTWNAGELRHNVGPLSKLVAPSRTILLAEFPGRYNAFAGSILGASLDVNQIRTLVIDAGNTGSRQGLELNGSGRFNYLFADGSVRTLTLEETGYDSATGSLSPDNLWAARGL